MQRYNFFYFATNYTNLHEKFCLNFDFCDYFDCSDFFQHRVHRESQSCTEKNCRNHDFNKIFKINKIANFAFSLRTLRFYFLPQSSQRFSQGTQRKNLFNLENLNKIKVQTKNANKFKTLSAFVRRVQ